MSRWVTGSSLDRAAACPGSMVLPRGPDKETSAARYGKKVHADLEAGRLPRGVDPEWYPPGGHHEIQAWFDPATGRGGFHTEGRNRDYSWAPDRYIVGTLDWVHFGNRHVDDLKTGMLLPSLDTLQLGLGAVALWDQEGPGDILISITSAPRGLDPRRFSQVLHSTSVDAARTTLKSLRADFLLGTESYISTGNSIESQVLVPGPHCRFCRAAACPVRER